MTRVVLFRVQNNINQLSQLSGFPVSQPSELAQSIALAVEMDSWFWACKGTACVSHRQHKVRFTSSTCVREFVGTLPSGQSGYGFKEWMPSSDWSCFLKHWSLDMLLFIAFGAFVFVLLALLLSLVTPSDQALLLRDYQIDASMRTVQNVLWKLKIYLLFTQTGGGFFAWPSIEELLGLGARSMHRRGWIVPRLLPQLP